jgi:hypothetical protein
MGEMVSRRDIVEQVGIGSRAGVDPYAARVAAGSIACFFQGFPRAFQKETLLRIHHGCFFGAVAKKFSIELVDLSDQCCSFDIVGLLQERGFRGEEIFVGQECQGFCTGA